MGKMLIKNAKALLGVREDAVSFVAGSAMKNLPRIEDGWLAIEDGCIVDFGDMASWPGISDWRDLEIIDASGRFVLPAWCDSHTHIVYAGSRVSEFVDRIHGLSYEEIAARGGGILNSADRLRKASEQELIESALYRLDTVRQSGTCAIEIKSGYGLDLESELKMLRVIQQLKSRQPLAIRATFLGAHAVPREFAGKPDQYLNLIIDEMLPAIATERLADYIDIFCEVNYFNVDHTHRLLEAASKFGLQAKTHVNQFNAIGGVAASVQHGARSVDHLEVLNEDDLEALAGSQTMPVALPGCSLFIQIPYTPAREIIDRGLPLALATDFNPGSAPSGNMNLVNSLACMRMRMTPEEVIHASTQNGAYAMGLENEYGSIERGKQAALIITRQLESVGEMMYSFGQSPIERMILPHETKNNEEM
ncbi:MAG: imidazolonepropionase [Flavobacteriales bacterium]